MFSGVIASEKKVCLERQVGGVLPDKEGETPSPVRGGSVAWKEGIPREKDWVGLRGEFSFLQTCHPNIMGGKELQELIPGVADPVAVKLQERGGNGERIVGRRGRGG